MRSIALRLVRVAVEGINVLGVLTLLRSKSILRDRLLSSGRFHGKKPQQSATLSLIEINIANLGQVECFYEAEGRRD